MLTWSLVTILIRRKEEIKMKKFFILLFIPIILGSCSRSRISAGGGQGGVGISGEDVAFNPSTTANLKTINYKAHLYRLTNLFQLSGSSDAITYLNTNKQIFDTDTYSSSLATSIVNLYSLACQEVANNTILFPDGINIDYLWEKLTGVEPNEDAKKLETDTLALVDSQPNDVKAFALCINASLDARAAFIGFQTVKTETP